VFDRNPTIAPITLIIQPTERSISPPAKTHVKPIPITADMEICLIIFIRLLNLKKYGELIAENDTRTAKITMVLYSNKPVIKKAFLLIVMALPFISVFLLAPNSC
jgi:hypothetical protein